MAVGARGDALHALLVVAELAVDMRGADLATVVAVAQVEAPVRGQRRPTLRVALDQQRSLVGGVEVAEHAVERVPVAGGERAEADRRRLRPRAVEVPDRSRRRLLATVEGRGHAGQLHEHRGARGADREAQPEQKAAVRPERRGLDVEGAVAVLDAPSPLLALLLTAGAAGSDERGSHPLVVGDQLDPA
ncbi:MAG TPA: hypothetical protein VNO82_09150, partial [Solirubrobacteraceae bacterium]|nr:hypothetical protein [Solirubrobacteraceae bacterium]